MKLVESDATTTNQRIDNLILGRNNDPYGRNELVSRRAAHDKIGRAIMGLVCIASTVLAGGLSFAAERANMPKQSLLLGAFAVVGLFQVGLIGYDHLRSANMELPDTVGPQVDDRRLLG